MSTRSHIYLHTNAYAQTYKTNAYKHTNTHTRIYTMQYKSLIYDFMFILLIKDSKIFLGVCYNYQYRVKKNKKNKKIRYIIFQNVLL